MKTLTLCLIVAFAAGGAAAVAAEKTISQKDKTFSETEITVKVGDTLTFVNDDNIGHNVLSSSAGNEFNLGSMAPGASAPFTFKKSGDVAVLCAIHPRMKMAVKVTD
jgi:plastocyanin